MIIWVTSFPRSGNTLVRTYLKAVFNEDSYSDEPQLVNFPNEVKVRFGHKDFEGLWQDFYEMAAKSEKTYFIKTHLPPKDSSPAIYVTRNGRNALQSYARYHTSFLNDRAKSLLELVLGADHYGGWGEHKKLWEITSGKKLFLRFEDMISSPSHTISSLQGFLGLVQVGEWINPFSELHKLIPEFFGMGKTSLLVNEEGWTPTIEKIFLLLEGESMVRSGYCSVDIYQNAINSIEPEIREWADITRNLIDNTKYLLKECTNRLDVINSLNAVLEEKKRVANG